MSIDFMALAKEKAASNGGGSTNYFSLADGETKIVRFLTGLEDYKVVSHTCCDALMDTRAALWDDAAVGGAPVLCPQCGEPLTEANVVYDRPGVLGAGMHKFVSCANNQKGSFVCLASPDNTLAGWVPAGPNGSNLYPCPICSSPQNQGERGPKPPSFRLFGIVIEREAEEETVMMQGVPTTVVKGVRDIMEPDENGILRPKVSLVDMGHKSFWSKLDNAMPSRNVSISSFDWKITRIGNGFDTTYDVQMIRTDTPQIIDMRAYEEQMPDIPAMLKRMGDPGFYYKKGWAVQGYTPTADDMQQGSPQGQAPQQPVQQPAQQAAPQVQQQYYPAAPQAQPAPMPQTQPVPVPGQPAMAGQPVPMPPKVAGANDWSAVAGQ